MATFPAALPSILGSLVTLYFADKQLDSYKYWKGKAEAIAERSQSKAEEVFDKLKALRARDAETFAALDALPDYERCDVGCDSEVMRRSLYDGYIAAADAVEGAMESVDCFEVGIGRDLIRQSMQLGSIASVNRMIDGVLIEDRRQDARNVLKLNAKVDSGDRSSVYAGLAGAYASAGEGYLAFMGEAGQAFNGSVAAFGYLGRSFLSQNRTAQSAPAFPTASYPRTPLPGIRGGATVPIGSTPGFNPDSGVPFT